MDTSRMTERSPHAQLRVRRWVFASAILLAIVWLGVSWMNGWVPFGAQRTVQQSQQVPDETQTSLPEEKGSVPVPDTASPPATADSILDSLTPKN